MEMDVGRKAYFTPRITNVIKGIALTMMFTHHFFTFPNWYIEGISYPELLEFSVHFCAPFQMCVPVFAFLSGYFYFFTPRQDLRYSLRKITDLFLHYWIAYVPMLLLVVATGNFSYTARDVLFELLAIVRPIMCFCWYVPFYSAAMLCLPFVVKILPEGRGASFLVGIAATHMTFLFLYSQTSSLTVYQIAEDMSLWFPVVMSGYLAAKHRLFEGLFDRLWKKNRSRAWRYAVWLFLAAAAFMGRYAFPLLTWGSAQFCGQTVSISINMDVVYAPCFIYAAANLIRATGRLPVVPIVQRILEALGKKSLLMWFLHCIFFGPANSVLQPYLYLPHNPILVVLWGLFLCYIPASLLERVARPIIAQKNKLLRLNADAGNFQNPFQYNHGGKMYGTDRQAKGAASRTGQFAGNHRTRWQGGLGRRADSSGRGGSGSPGAYQVPRTGDR